jgi:predicted TIM-barrel fold metal-dependent hydrolase
MPLSKWPILPSVLIADAQVHVWAADSPDRPWPENRGSEAQKPYPVGPEALLLQMDLAGVQRVVLVPPSWEGERNDLALAAAASYADRFGVMGRLSLTDPASRDLVPGWRDQPGMLGMRFTFHNRFNRHLLTDGSADWLWDAAEHAGIPLMVLLPGQLDVLDRLAGEHPGLKFTIDHVGISLRPNDPSVWDELPNVCALAKHPNIAVKASGIPHWSQQPYPFTDVHGHLRRLFDAFGPERMFWGTDLTRMPCTYYECIHLFTDHLPWLKGDDLESVMGRAVCEWLGWPISAP